MFFGSQLLTLKRLTYLCVLIYLKALLFIFLAAKVLLEAGLCWEMDF